METKNCQNCKKDFVIEQEDFNFYEKIKVPPPTWCPECRFIRRLSFMNVYSLYKRKCDKCGEDIISMFHKDKNQIVFCSKCWWADDWDGTEYAMDYDPNRNFLEQLMELQSKTPYMSVDTLYSSLVNTGYTNYSSHLKNSYGLFFADYADNCFYCDFLNTLKDSADCYRGFSSELCYECIGLGRCYMTFFSEECDDCVNVYFSRNCYGCTDCIGCVNLSGASNCILNVKYSKKEYEEKLRELNFESYKDINDFKEKAYKFWLTKPYRAYHGHSLNKDVTGDYVYESKNSKEVYLLNGGDDCKYCQFMTVKPLKDCYDYTCWGGNTERAYETLVAGHGAYNIKFSVGSYPDALNNEYCYYVSSCKNAFGCANLKHKEYCILNKQYSKKEYETLRLKIIEDMGKNPYIDKKGRIYKYGEFLPYESSPFGYNETMANQYFPKKKEGALNCGLKWFDFIPNEYMPTIKFDQLPDILDGSQNILKEVIECSCGRCFKVTKGEFGLLKKMKVFIPRQCPECRRLDRFNRTLLPKLYNRNCMKCDKDIRTPYSPDRPEIIYCEKCYQQEVY